MKKTRMMCLIMALLLIFQAACIVQPAAAAEVGDPIDFSDIPEGFWAEKEIDFMSGMGYLIGKADGTFGPRNSIMRKTVALLLYRISGEPAVSGYMPFTDVSDGIYYNAILWASQAGVINGYEDGTFRPDSTISRQHFAIMLHRYSLFKGYVLNGDHSRNLSVFADSASITEASEDACQWAYANGFIVGRENGNFEPWGATTRAQLAVIMYRFLYAASEADLHSHVCSPVEVIPATCISAGYSVYTCDCGYTYRADYVASGDHAWSDWAVAVEATKEAEGKEVRTCSSCGASEEQAIEKISTKLDCEEAMACGIQYAVETYGWTYDSSLNADNSGYEFGTFVFEADGQERLNKAAKWNADCLYETSMTYYGYADGARINFNIYEQEEGIYVVYMYYG